MIAKTKRPQAFKEQHPEHENDYLGQQRDVSFFALKGTRVIILNGIWRSGPVTDANMKQTREGARIALSKLP